MASDYDLFAWFYDRYWSMPHHRWQGPALDRLLYRRVAPGARVLDLCCGSGHLVQELAGRGYRCVGVDSSLEMLRLAREKAPDAQFIHADAADFNIEEPVDAAVCLFDSVNHILNPAALEQAFRNVNAALKPGGLFVLDSNTGEAYGERWAYASWEVQPDHSFVLRGSFDRALRIGVTQITMFRLGAEGWQRADAAIQQRPWEPSELETMLRSAGFVNITCAPASEALGITGHYGTGRVFFSACKSAAHEDSQRGISICSGTSGRSGWR